MTSKAPRFYVGSVADAEKLGRRGWFVGRFSRAKSRRTEKFEIKSWHFGVGQTGHKLKKSKSVWEFTLVLSGRGKGVIGRRKVELRRGDCFVVPPGIRNNFPEVVLNPIRGITVKAPSRKASKQLC